jgi:general stress protein YciG
MTKEQRIARAGGQATKKKYGFCRCNLGFIHRTSEFYAQNGANGGKKTVELYGPEHMSQIGRLGGRPRNKEGQHVKATDSVGRRVE